MEVRHEQAVDQLFRGRWHGSTAVQHHTDPEERLVHGPMAVPEAVRPQQGCQEGAHANDPSEINF